MERDTQQQVTQETEVLLYLYIIYYNTVTHMSLLSLLNTFRHEVKKSSSVLFWPHCRKLGTGLTKGKCDGNMKKAQSCVCSLAAIQIQGTTL